MRLNHISFSVIITLIVFYTKVEAKVVLPALFQDNLVLQQKAEVAIWGWAEPGETALISGSWYKAPVKAVADKNGKWLARLKTQVAGRSHTIIVQGKDNLVKIENVLFGEVWLCSGQSNMNFPIEKKEGWRTGVPNYENEIQRANNPNIRFFTVAQKVSDEPLTDVQGKWELTTPETVGSFSAVAYYFAKEVQKSLGVPVGIIHSSWGGTPVESWTRREILESRPDFKVLIDTYNEQLTHADEASEGHKSAVDEWKRKVSTGAIRGIDSVQGPRDLLTAASNKSPYKLYNAMIAPLIPFTLKGVLWYQGESNMERARQYLDLFPAIIKGWRSDWKANLPFYFVQIAPHRQQHPEIREAQLQTAKTVSNTGMAVITDAGDSLDIHPRNKAVVGKRLALWAVAKTYNKKGIVYSGPMYKSMKIEGDKVRISFDHAARLKAKNDVLHSFTIAGSDKKFVAAKAKIEGNSVVIWNDFVKAPTAVRFGWTYVPHAELFNEADLPASPFRTDNWDWETAGRNIYSDYVN